MSATPRYYKWYPTVSCDLGIMPFEGDYTTNDKIMFPVSLSGGGWIWEYYISNASGTEFGRQVKKKVGVRIQNVWQAGVLIPEPLYTEIDGQQVQVPIYFAYYGDGVCVAKLPAGEQPEPVEV